MIEEPKKDGGVQLESYKKKIKSKPALPTVRLAYDKSQKLGRQDNTIIQKQIIEVFNEIEQIEDQINKLRETEQLHGNGVDADIGTFRHEPTNGELDRATLKTKADEQLGEQYNKNITYDQG